mmetsp:Transcript_17336/g.37652  ORF Transcript_17336/g.37652 Transcript_17336/m.37652 type:complete len:166 (+) Transcript_17336:190-687(+)
MITCGCARGNGKAQLQISYERAYAHMDDIHPPRNTISPRTASTNVQGDVETVMALLDAGANVDLVNQHGQTALMLSAQFDWHGNSGVAAGPCGVRRCKGQRIAVAKVSHSERELSLLLEHSVEIECANMHRRRAACIEDQPQRPWPCFLIVMHALTLLIVKARLR